MLLYSLACCEIRRRFSLKRSHLLNHSNTTSGSTKNVVVNVGVFTKMPPLQIQQRLHSTDVILMSWKCFLIVVIGTLVQWLPKHTGGSHPGYWGRGGRWHGHELRTCQQISYYRPSAYRSASNVSLSLASTVVAVIASSFELMPRWVMSKIFMTSLLTSFISDCHFWIHRWPTQWSL